MSTTINMDGQARIWDQASVTVPDATFIADVHLDFAKKLSAMIAERGADLILLYPTPFCVIQSAAMSERQSIEFERDAAGVHRDTIDPCYTWVDPEYYAGLFDGVPLCIEKGPDIGLVRLFRGGQLMDTLTVLQKSFSFI